MTLVIEDTARNNLASWVINAVNGGTVTGAVISPFTTPTTTGPKQSAQLTVERLQNEGVDVWVDSETHALQMPAVGDFRYYDAWPLWGGTRGALATAAEMRDHVERVYEQQDQLGVPHLAPTSLTHSPQSQESEVAFEFAEIANDVDPDARLAIAGDAAFWASPNLDAHIGALAQLGPPSWSLTVVRSFTVLPVPAGAEEVHGLCRTARALSEDRDVHISHGDLAGLPAVAAGATTLGTGWDPRQRISAYSSYEARVTGGEGGGTWFQQVSFDGLLSLLGRAEATLLQQQDQALSARLHPGTIIPGASEAFLHHADVLSRVVADLSAADHAAAYADLVSRYAGADQDWHTVAGAIGIASRATQWLTGVTDGLLLYGVTEGF